MGHDWGSYIVQRYAAEHPHDLSKLVLLDVGNGPPKLSYLPVRVGHVVWPGLCDRIYRTLPVLFFVVSPFNLMPIRCGCVRVSVCVASVFENFVGFLLARGSRRRKRRTERQRQRESEQNETHNAHPLRHLALCTRLYFPIQYCVTSSAYCR